MKKKDIPPPPPPGHRPNPDAYSVTDLPPPPRRKAELGLKPRKAEIPPQIPGLTEELKDQFNVYRDDPFDPFKPHSEQAVHTSAQLPAETALTEKEEALLQSAAVTFERSVSMERVHDYPDAREFPPEIRIELQRMPNWLSAMVVQRFNLIQAYYKGETLSFLKSVNHKIDREFRPEFAFVEGILATDKDTLLADEDERETRELPRFSYDESGADEDKKDVFQQTGANVAFRVTEAIGRWRRTRDNAIQWHPLYVGRVVRRLRECLSLRPAETDLIMTQEDVTHKSHSESEDSEFDEDGKPKYEIIKRRERLQNEADIKIERDILRGQELAAPGTKPKKKKKKKNNKRKKTVVSTKNSRDGSKSLGSEAETDEDWEDVVEGPSVIEINKRRQQMRSDALDKDAAEKNLGPVAMRRKLFSRGHFRRDSRLLHKGCGERVERPKRLEYHYRGDDNFHQYIVWLVSTKYFRFFIMFIIMLNALCLAIENDERLGKNPVLFEILDEAFLAIYLVEAIVKIYAHPLKYWTSGFNCFDFCILIISLIKACIDWADLADLAILRVLLIVRALRMLRGISLSVQLQVLVAALVETIRTHVISVCLLLVLLIYIAAIVFFYVFSDESEILRDSWGFVPKGMLRMIVFVTLDGWTEILQEFKDSGLETTGRFFNLIAIVLGNFMFSNIFIAIIIMNISEATDSYRDRQRLEKQEVVRKKKDMVFRRQKLDMRQLLARQKKSATADFFYLTSQFRKLLRHDDLVSMDDVCTSPLWMDALFNCLLRVNNTSNIAMNLHREMADNLTELSKLYATGKENIQEIRRSRYNRYMKIKAKLALIKREILDLRSDPPKPKLLVTFDDDDEFSTRPTPRPSYTHLKAGDKVRDMTKRPEQKYPSPPPPASPDSRRQSLVPPPQSPPPEYKPRKESLEKPEPRRASVEQPEPQPRKKSLEPPESQPRKKSLEPPASQPPPPEPQAQSPAPKKDKTDDGDKKDGKPPGPPPKKDKTDDDEDKDDDGKPLVYYL